MIQEVKTYRIWCRWDDETWTAETVSKLIDEPKFYSEARRKIADGFEVQ